MRKISLSEIDKLFERISSGEALYIPVDTAGGARFERWESGKTMSDALNTVRSAKDFFFPQTENLMDFKVEGKNIEVIDTRNECEDFVVFGVRGCDVKSFEVLDRVFLSEPVDSFYKNRREHSVIMSMACTKPVETCFCSTFGIDAAEPEGDVVCYRTDDTLYLKPVTEKGEKLLDTLKEVSEAGGEEKVEEIKKNINEVVNKLPYMNIDLSVFKEENLNELFNLPDWGELSEACLGCGTCTFVCPTCQCFDIRDFRTDSGAIRFRCWDSCMYRDFTQMAAANSRNTQMQRFRQRFMHKLVYYPSQYGGTYSCVGCGRCVNKCPQHLNILKVVKKIGGKKIGN